MTDQRNSQFEEAVSAAFFDLQALLADTVKTGRFSIGLVVDLAVYHVLRAFDARQVISEISYLEGRSSASVTKPEAPFLREPLTGFWHKHFFSSGFLPRNVANEIYQIDLFQGIPKGSVLTEEIIALLAHRATVGAFTNRAKRQALSGEWLVFEKTETGHYYICISSHGQDNLTAEKINRYRKLDADRTNISEIKFGLSDL